MNSTTIRVSFDTRDRLASLAKAADQPMTVTLDEALDALERRRFFDDVNRRYAELRNEDEWQVILQERKVEEGALRDDLD